MALTDCWLLCLGSLSVSVVLLPFHPWLGLNKLLISNNRVIRYKVSVRVYGITKNSKRGNTLVLHSAFAEHNAVSLESSPTSRLERSQAWWAATSKRPIQDV